MRIFKAAGTTERPQIVETGKSNGHFTENTVVRLKRGVSTQSGPREKAYIIGWIAGVKGGVVLNRPLDKFTSWNIDELEIVGDGSMENL